MRSILLLRAVGSSRRANAYRDLATKERIETSVELVSIRASRYSTGEWCTQASAAVMPTVDSMTGFIFLSSAS